MSIPNSGDIVRITPHPDDPRIILLHVPHGCNDLMGRYEPAQLDVELRAYLLRADHLESFERFAQYTGLYVLDERTMTPAQAVQDELCDICMRPEKTCQRAAGNSGVHHDHDFIATRQANAQRALKRGLKA